jgi:putative nucleotidyltransferase with HDIG domain
VQVTFDTQGVKRWRSLRERPSVFAWTSVAHSKRFRLLGGLATGAGIGLAYAGTDVAGGTKSGMTQLFYLPIFAAATVYGPLGGAVAGTISGVVCALIPFDVATGLGQDTRSWVVSGTFFVLAGVLTGALSSSLGSRIRQLERLRQEAVSAFERAVDAMHHYTAEHSAAVADCAVAIARELHVDAATIARVRGAALLHDVGKLSVPATVLDKPGPLSPEEWQTVHGHVEASLTIVGCIEEFRPYMAGIRHHHERYDGGGYPDGLRRKDIPLEARIIAVADAYDAMVSPRAYRPQLNHATALAILKRQSESQFDPDVVGAFISASTPVDQIPGDATALDRRVAGVDLPRDIASAAGSQ